MEKYIIKKIGLSILLTSFLPCIAASMRHHHDPIISTIDEAIEEQITRNNQTVELLVSQKSGLLEKINSCNSLSQHDIQEIGTKVEKIDLAILEKRAQIQYLQERRTPAFRSRRLIE